MNMNINQYAAGENIFAQFRGESLGRYTPNVTPQANNQLLPPQANNSIGGQQQQQQGAQSAARPRRFFPTAAAGLSSAGTERTASAEDRVDKSSARGTATASASGGSGPLRRQHRTTSSSSGQHSRSRRALEQVGKTPSGRARTVDISNDDPASHFQFARQAPETVSNNTVLLNNIQRGNLLRLNAGRQGQQQQPQQAGTGFSHHGGGRARPVAQVVSGQQVHIPSAAAAASDQSGQSVLLPADGFNGGAVQL